MNHGRMRPPRFASCLSVGQPTRRRRRLPRLRKGTASRRASLPHPLRRLRSVSRGRRQSSRCRRRYRVQFTASVAFREKIERLQDLMRASVPDGDLARLLEQAVTEKLPRLEAKRFGASRSGPAKHFRVVAPPLQRYIPAAVRRAVYDRDRGRCRFVDDEGRRCRSRTRLEFHHVHPFARGGRGSLENIRLMCRAHNSLAAERDYGAGHMARARRTASGEGLVSRPPP